MFEGLFNIKLPAGRNNCKPLRMNMYEFVVVKNNCRGVNLRNLGCVCGMPDRGHLKGVSEMQLEVQTRKANNYAEELRQQKEQNLAVQKQVCVCCGP